MMTVQTLGLILATLMTIVAAVGWSRCRKLAFDLKQVKHDLDLTINEKENLIKARGKAQVQVIFDTNTFWLSQQRMAELFGVTVPTINYHLGAACFRHLMAKKIGVIMVKSPTKI